MEGLYQVRIGNELKTYYRLDDIPDKFDNLIRFEPKIPEGPHTEEEHEFIESLNGIMKSIMERETR